MRLIIFLVVLLPNICLAQEDSLDNTISGYFCNCLSKIKSVNQTSVTECLQDAILDNNELVLRYLEKKSNDSSYDSGYKFGKELGNRVQVSAVYTCDIYYSFMDTVRYSFLHDINKDSVKNIIQVMSADSTKSRDFRFYTQRGIMYFVLMELDNALKDFDNAIKLDDEAFQSIFFKACVLEFKKQYDESIVLYHKAVKLTGKVEFLIYAAIAKRKKTGK